MPIKTSNLFFRGYAKLDDGIWYAVCLDFCLAAQGDTCEEAMELLFAQIQEYVYDALAGEDKAHAIYLLNRKAPLSQWAEFYTYRILHKLHVLKNGFAKLLPVPLSLAPPRIA